MTISRAHVSTHRGDVIYLEAVRWPVVLLDRNQCSISYFLASLRALENWWCTHIGHQCCDQLTAVKTDIRWPASLDRIAGSGVDPLRSSTFLKLSADELLVFKWSQPQVFFFFYTHMKYVVYFCRTIKIFISNWPRERKFQPAITGRQDSCFWLCSPWSRVGQVLRPIFILWLVKIWQVSLCRKYAASWILFTLRAEADRVSCQLVMFLTVFFHWMDKMKFSCYQESSFIHG